MIVRWTNLAIEHLADIHEYIARTSASYAVGMIDRLIRRAEQIGNFPYSGRIVPEKNDASVRELLEGPYRLIYRIRTERIDIVAVIHGARDWESRETEI